MKKIFISVLICPALLFGQIKLNLNDAIDTALKNNHEILKAKEEIKAAKGRFWSSISLPPPEISLSYEYTPLSKSLTSFGEKTFELSQSFDFPTNYFLKGAKGNNEIDAVKSDFNNKAAEILGKVEKKYFEVKAKEEEIKIAKENLKLAEEFQRKADIRYGAGEGAYLEKITSKVQHTQAQNNLRTLENELKILKSSFLLLLGKSERENENYILSDTLLFHEFPCKIEELLNQSEMKNPSLLNAKYLSEASSIKKTLSWSSILPSFKFSYYRQALNGGSNDYYGVSFGASIPLWFLFDQRGQIQEATAEYNASNFEFERIKNFINTEIKNEFLILKNDEREVLLYIDEIIPQAAEVYRTANSSYEVGEISYLEYLQASQTFIETRNGYIRALLKYQTSLITLKESSGLILEQINYNGD